MSERATVEPDVEMGVPKTESHGCFACGDVNDVGLHLQIRPMPEGAWAELTVAEHFEGWKGVVHGGILATILDDVMSWPLTDLDFWGVTARLDISFRKPALTGRLIRVEGRLVENRRRIVKTSGRIIDVETGDELATAEATFVAVGEAQKQILQARYGDLARRRKALMRNAAQPADASATAEGRP
jgi:acyl-coenzyme A thioesterase PaaI-like protein